MSKTNAARLLDILNIEYELIHYIVDESDLSAIHVAQQLDEDPLQVFKTLVLQGDKNGYFVCIIPGPKEVDLKLVAKISGNKRCNMLPMKDLLAITGYIRGACSPIAMKKKYPTFIHYTCTNFKHIYISAGTRGLQIKISPNDLIKIVDMQIVNLI